MAIRIPLGRGRYLALFADMLVLEYYDRNGMAYARRMLHFRRGSK